MIKEVEVEKEVQVVVTATPEPAMMMEEPAFHGNLRLGESLSTLPYSCLASKVLATCSCSSSGASSNL